MSEALMVEFFRNKKKIVLELPFLMFRKYVTHQKGIVGNNNQPVIKSTDLKTPHVYHILFWHI